MPKSTLLSSLFGGLAQGANYAGQNLLPYKQQQRQNERQEGLDEERLAQQYLDNQYRQSAEKRATSREADASAVREFNIGNMGTLFDQSQEDRETQNLRDDIRFGQGTERFKQGTEQFEQGVDQFDYDKSQRGVNAEMARRINESNIAATKARTSATTTKANTTKPPTQGAINSAREAGMSRNLNLSLADLANAARQGRSIFGDEDITDIFDDLPDDYREMLPSELANAFTEAGYEVGMIPSLDSMMQKAMQYEHGANIDIQKLEAVRNAPPPASTTTPEAIESRRGIQGMRQQYSDQR